MPDTGKPPGPHRGRDAASHTARAELVERHWEALVRAELIERDGHEGARPDAGEADE